MLIALPIRFSFERVKPLRTPLMTEATYQEGRARFLTYRVNEVVFGEPYPIAAMFFSDCLAAYTWPPSKEVQDSLRKENHVLRFVTATRK